MLGHSATGSGGSVGAVRLSDGRRLAYRAAGPADGFPVVYCHGAMGAPRWYTAELDELCHRLRMRYLLVHRPGFGGSDPQPGRTVADFAGDLEQVMDVLGHRRFAVVGVSSGAPYALACGWSMPKRTARLAIVSPLVPAAGAGASAGLRYRAALIPFGAWPSTGPGGASHRASHRCARAALRLLGLLRDTEPAAMIDDYRVCRADWGFDLTSLSVPVTVWHGSRDLVVPIAHGRRLAAVIPGCPPCRVAPGGHFVYARAMGTIIDSLLGRPLEPPSWPDVVAPRPGSARPAPGYV